MLKGQRLGFWLTASCAAMALATPITAKVHNLQLTGVVHTVEGDAVGSDIKAGDAIAAAFKFDGSLASKAATLPLGGGEYTIYAAPLTGVSVSIGDYGAKYAQFNSTLTYMDDSFGQDGIVFSLEQLPGGPFQSTFASIQFQARGPTDAVDGSGIGNGLPYGRLAPSFFAIFSNGSASERVFGTLSLVTATPVPEPATWAMMFVGFALVGAAMRRAREVEVLA